MVYLNRPIKHKFLTKIILTYALIGILNTSAYAFDLLDAWHAAKQYNANLLAADYQRKAGQEKFNQGVAQLLPQVSASADYSSNETTKPKTSKQFETHGWTVKAVQPLFDVGKYAAFKQGQTNAQLAQVQFNQTEQTFMVEVAQAYFELLLVHDTLEATRSAKNAYAKQLQRAKAAFNAGAATIVDTHEAQANYDAAVAKEITAQSDLDIKANQLQMLTGLNPAQIQKVDGQKVLQGTTEYPLEKLQDLAIDNNPEVKAKEHQVTLVRQELLARRGDRFPKIQLTSSYNNRVNNTPSSFWNPTTHLSQGYAVGVEASIPLFTGGAIHSQVKESKYKRSQALEELEAAKRLIKEKVRQAYLGITNGEAEVKAMERLLSSRKTKLDSTRKGQEFGVRTSLDLLDAESEYYETIRSLAEVRYRYLLSQLQLAQAVGVLNEGILAKTNSAIREVE
ncbi:TolC family outer membrane protein [Neisseria sp. Ec49-e6-T10]|uniref:TolC family outer membrane protein n=1 Tax=Neisseria sp. Ec49-e6-T10 TaxID=3140744 RepID=UPI003EBD35D3